MHREAGRVQAADLHPIQAPQHRITRVQHPHAVSIGQGGIRSLLRLSQGRHGPHNAGRGIVERIRRPVVGDLGGDLVLRPIPEPGDGAVGTPYGYDPRRCRLAGGSVRHGIGDAQQRILPGVRQIHHRLRQRMLFHRAIRQGDAVQGTCRHIHAPVGKHKGDVSIGADRGIQIHEIFVIHALDPQGVKIHGANFLPLHDALEKGETGHAAGEVIEAVEIFAVAEQVAKAIRIPRAVLRRHLGQGKVVAGIAEIVADQLRRGGRPQGVGVEHFLIKLRIRILLPCQDVQRIIHRHYCNHGRILGVCKKQGVFRRGQGENAHAYHGQRQQEKANSFEQRDSPSFSFFLKNAFPAFHWLISKEKAPKMVNLE